MACTPRLLLENEATDPSNDYVTPEIFSMLKEALLCPVCYDVFKNPVQVK
jgi:hypothetical protein